MSSKYVWLNGSWPFKLETRLFYCLLSLEGIVDLKARQPLLSLPRRLEWNDIPRILIEQAVQYVRPTFLYSTLAYVIFQDFSDLQWWLMGVISLFPI